MEEVRKSQSSVLHSQLMSWYPLMFSFFFSRKRLHVFLAPSYSLTSLQHDAQHISKSKKTVMVQTDDKQRATTALKWSVCGRITTGGCWRDKPGSVVMIRVMEAGGRLIDWRKTETEMKIFEETCPQFCTVTKPDLWHIQGFDTLLFSTCIVRSFCVLKSNQSSKVTTAVKMLSGDFRKISDTFIMSCTKGSTNFLKLDTPKISKNMFSLVCSIDGP